MSISRVMRRELCSNECPYYDVCPLKDLSLAKARQYEEATGKTSRPLCSLKDKPEYVKDAFRNLLLSPIEDGLVAEMKKYLMLLAMRAGRPNAEIKDMKEAIEATIKVHKALVVDNKKASSGNNITFNVKIINPKDKKEPKILNPVNSDDPESLFFEA